MSPTQKIKWKILACAARWEKETLPAITAENVDALYDALVARDGHWDAVNEVRSSGIVHTGLPTKNAPYQLIRHYEHEEVAAEMPDGTWVGWTYWHGGGKFGDPDGIPWMADAYAVLHSEKERVIIEHVFSLPEPS